ncbi:hypothetical protein ALC57_05608 [Trachymyrmex cornetzi]|uniref:Zinc finger BED domain-containing protein 1 n=1 Tax=Trachymyrmex cornetzi TaxID=471704 RepID=A0A151JAC6_9HYME|nr:hypothetical protein ALC57_05608 [Trachymyrmex cornetzi]
MVATDFQPFTIVNDTGFQEFVNLLDPRYKLPSTYTLSEKLLQEAYLEAYNKLKTDLNKINYVGITCDSWTFIANEPYLIVTCHYIHYATKLSQQNFSSKFCYFSPLTMETFKNEQKIKAEDQSLKLIQEVPTRWNSTFYMVERIIESNNALGRILLKLRKAPQPFSVDDMTLLADIKKVLSSPYETRSLTRLGIILDPRFKKEGFRNQENASTAAKILEQEMLTLSHRIQKNEISTNYTESKKLSTTLICLFGFLQERINKKVKSATTDIIIIKRQYLERHSMAENTDPLLFWKVSYLKVLKKLN